MRCATNVGMSSSVRSAASYQTTLRAANLAGDMPAKLNIVACHALVLRVWEAVNVECNLAGVLAAVAGVLTGEVPFAAIGIVSFEGGRHDL
jgi:hypothetical protein